MNIVQQTLKEHSKSNTDAVVAYIGQDPHRFEQLTKLLLSGSRQEAQRAAWPFFNCTESFPAMILPYLDSLVSKLKDATSHPAVKRSILRSLQFVEIPKHLQGPLLDICFDTLTNSKSPVAIKAFAMTVAYNIGRHEQSLLHELSILIEDQMPYASPGFRSRGNRILKAIKTPQPAMFKA